jgi:uncharacterized membrane protein
MYLFLTDLFDSLPLDSKGFFPSTFQCQKSVHFFDIMSQNAKMSIKALNDLKQSILSTIEAKGIEAAQSEHVEALPALSVERRQAQRIFAQLEQDQTGKWGFREQ